jgi:hypothetical protein
LPLFQQSLEIGFQPGAIVIRMLKQQLDQAALTGTKLPMNTATGKPMQESDGLLGEQSFKFVGGHALQC